MWPKQGAGSGCRTKCQPVKPKFDCSHLLLFHQVCVALCQGSPRLELAGDGASQDWLQTPLCMTKREIISKPHAWKISSQKRMQAWMTLWLTHHRLASGYLKWCNDSTSNMEQLFDESGYCFARRQAQVLGNLVASPWLLRSTGRRCHR